MHLLTAVGCLEVEVRARGLSATGTVPHTLIAISNLDRLLLKKSKLRLAEKCYGASKRFVRSTKSLGHSVGRLFMKAEASLTAARG